ncbi:hypothetical protein BDC45DRAFT_541700 [Circinella umbellata]|nr:hypothetical protein BDC45DRAFT_541700 [Circinella umbellata]
MAIFSFTARKDSKEGWAPSNYLEEYFAPKPTPAPPPPPDRRAAPPPPPASNSISSPRSSNMSPPSTTTTQPIPVMPGVAASSSNGVPPWKAQLEARKAAQASGNVPTPAPRPVPGATPVPAARRAPPAPGPKPVIPAKPSTMGKPVVPARPGTTPSPAPRAPPRPTSTSPPSNAAASLADAIRARRQQQPQQQHESDDECETTSSPKHKYSNIEFFKLQHPYSTTYFLLSTGYNSYLAGFQLPQQTKVMWWR